MAVKAVKAPPPAPFDPWDIAFGSAIMNDYIFRGVTQSNHKPSVAAYFEPRYNVTKDLQLYVGIAGESISFPNRAAAEIDIYGGIRPTVGMFAFDFGAWGYLYPGGQCFGVSVGTRRLRRSFQPGIDSVRLNWRPADQRQLRQEERELLRSLRQGERHHQRPVRGRLQRVLFAELPQPRRLGQLRLDHRQVDRALDHLRHQRRRHVHLRRIRPAVARHLGCLLRHDCCSRFGGPFPGGIPEPSYNTWNIGIGFTYKVFTLDLRYSDTNLSKGDCNAFTSDYTTTNFSHGSFMTAINPGGLRLQLVRRGRHRQALG